ncbi:MAG: extracellular solute-binding protein [Thermotogae bacterium]|nr:extracellular solute-binding protein [Thermotogota bacterium]
MRKFYLILSLIFVLMMIPALSVAQEDVPVKVRLRMLVAGDQNMVDFFQYEIAPLFEKMYPNVRVYVIGTGPGPAGSRAIVEKLKIEKESGKDKWDIDVAILHEIGVVWALKEGLLRKFTDFLIAKRLTVRNTDKMALGVNIDGYVMPMFHSQTALAYNPDYVKDPPKSYEELVKWVKEHPGKFGYNGIKHGASGISFVAGWLYWKSKNPDVLMNGPYDKKYEEDWEAIFKELKEFNKYVTMTSGNAGTLDMLNRGEIWMGPVWVDMFYTWIREGRMDPKIKLLIPAPGMPGQPMHYTIPLKARNADYALRLIDFVSSPKIHAKFIVEKFNWYPAIGDEYVKPYLSKETLNSLYRDIKPGDLLKYGKPFPLTGYFEDMLEAYERWVEK